MDRPTKKVETKSKHKLVLYEWITKGDRLGIQKAASKNMEGVYDKESTQVTIKNMGSGTTEEATLKAALKSVDGKEGDEMTNYVLNGMRETECDEILEEVNKVTDPEDTKKK